LAISREVLVIVRALDVCVELNLSAGIDYHESLVQLSILESDRAKYSELFLCLLILWFWPTAAICLGRVFCIFAYSLGTLWF